MKYREYSDAASFFKRSASFLEKNEAVNSLMIGLSLELDKAPFLYSDQNPYFATVTDNSEILIAALMTPPYKILLSSAETVPDDAVSFLVECIDPGKWTVPGVLAEHKLAETFTFFWKSKYKIKTIPGMDQRIYMLTQIEQAGKACGEMRPAAAGDSDLVADWVYKFNKEIFTTENRENAQRLANALLEQKSVFFWYDNTPVSMAATLRPTAHGTTVGYVYTPPYLRNNGYAGTLVAQLSRQILDSGKNFCTLYTDLSNPTSNSIYKKIGYKPVADVIDIFFE